MVGQTLLFVSLQQRGGKDSCKRFQKVDGEGERTRGSVEREREGEREKFMTRLLNWDSISNLDNLRLHMIGARTSTN